MTYHLPLFLTLSLLGKLSLIIGLSSLLLFFQLLLGLFLTLYVLLKDQGRLTLDSLIKLPQPVLSVVQLLSLSLSLYLKPAGGISFLLLDLCEALFIGDQTRARRIPNAIIDAAVEV